MDSLNSLVVFVQVAETRSFVGAARQLGVSASAIGKSVMRLEQKLGVRLFHRSTRSMTLTAEGGLFLQRCRHILAQVEAAELELSQASSAARGRLRVSLPHVGTLLVPVFAEFMRAYPEIELELDFTDQVVDVIEEGFDAVVRTGEPQDSRLKARRLGEFQYLLVASPDYLAQHGCPQAPADLVGHRCLHYRFARTGQLESWPLRQAPDAPPVSVPTTMVCNHIETRLAFACQGLGIAYLPDFSIRDALAQGQLQPILTDHIQRSGVFYVLWPASQYASPKVRALVDFLCARVFEPKHSP